MIHFGRQRRSHAGNGGDGVLGVLHPPPRETPMRWAAWASGFLFRLVPAGGWAGEAWHGHACARASAWARPMRMGAWAHRLHRRRRNGIGTAEDRGPGRGLGTLAGGGRYVASGHAIHGPQRTVIGPFKAAGSPGDTSAPATARRVFISPFRDSNSGPPAQAPCGPRNPEPTTLDSAINRGIGIGVGKGDAIRAPVISITLDRPPTFEKAMGPTHHFLKMKCASSVSCHQLRPKVRQAKEGGGAVLSGR